MCGIVGFIGTEQAAPILLEGLPGVTIGSGAVIGAGSVVSRDVPPNVVAAGSPCRVLRPIHPGGTEEP